MDFTSVSGNPESGRIIVTLKGVMEHIRKTCIFRCVFLIVTCTQSLNVEKVTFMKGVDFIIILL